ncbi:hypothetical protein ACHQM5_021521 [Ranunculus cassubicifolius]
MAIVSRNSNNKWRDREISPERTKVWTEPTSKVKTERKRVPVVYYLCRDGQLEHPHFMEVPISSNEGLHLKDVINRLNSLRGKGMASLYSWSSKRSYKNGFVWHDLSENDFIYPAHGQEYVLKGSEIHDSSSASFSSQETVSSGEKLPENQRSGEDRDFPAVVRRRNQSWSALDLHEYKVYKSESAGDYAGKAADASTQTDDKRRRQRKISIEEEDESEDKITQYEEQHSTELTQQNFTELNREEISPPPSSSSPETLETLIQADGSVIEINNGSNIQTADMHPSGRMKASTVLMQLISCGSFSAKDYASAQSTTTTKDHHQGFSLMSHYRSRLPRGPPNQPKELESPMENPSFGRIQLEDKEYFSGSLIETKKSDFSALKRSSSYNADRSSKLELKEREIEGVRAKCMPRRPKIPTRSTGTSTIDASKISIEGSK